MAGPRSRAATATRTLAKPAGSGFSHERRKQLIIVLIVSVLCFLTFAPLIWVLLTSIKPTSEIYTTQLMILPRAPTLEHYRAVLAAGKLATYVLNTLLYAGVSIGIIALFSSMAGYALGMLDIPLSGVITNLVLIVLSVPFVILLVPMLLFEFKLGIYNTRLGLILPYIALFSPLGIWIMKGTFTGMPTSLGEAARIDGATEFDVFFRVYLPMAAGGVATVVILLFIAVWNEVLLATTLIHNPAYANINYGVRLLAEEGQSFAFGTLSAVIILAMIPTLAIFILLQRYYVRGISEGALAGF